MDLTPEEIRIEALFHDWIAQGEGRSLKIIAEKAKLPESMVYRYANKAGWFNRIPQIVATAAEKTMDFLSTDVAKINAQHVMIFNMALEKAMEVIKREHMTVKDALAVLRLLPVAREILGLGAGQAGTVAAILGKKLEQIAQAGDAPPSYKLDRKKLSAPVDIPDPENAVDPAESEEEADE